MKKLFKVMSLAMGAVIAASGMSACGGGGR